MIKIIVYGVKENTKEVANSIILALDRIGLEGLVDVIFLEGEEPDNGSSDQVH